MNISKEEYIAAYIQYMSNVRRRKEDLWKDVGPKRRRKNATTKINIFKGEGFAGIFLLYIAIVLSRLVEINKYATFILNFLLAFFNLIFVEF
jgi:hypothetical protein